jgi:succinate-acetate transporter protein
MAARMTELGPPLFFWVMLALVVGGFAWALVAAVRHRYAQAVVGGSIGVIVAIAMWYFANTGAFCVAPPGSACL